ncbi:putative Eukaryotic translation initiation factor 1A; X-chromosomal [Paratrimastix pyriformis]|uniref:Eukaryotic translation initiation factor 4C n=1 Tax=Paratrimastix pyriformis TaxID=342808 RepID=A0ABQ8UYP3_9EUKA|nr:putative Eukaryotic translation initiation factor 1A; X-chromosomal [Paratrimastix pyriformis]
MSHYDYGNMLALLGLTVRNLLDDIHAPFPFTAPSRPPSPTCKSCPHPTHTTATTILRRCEGPGFLSALSLVSTYDYIRHPELLQIVFRGLYPRFFDSYPAVEAQLFAMSRLLPHLDLYNHFSAAHPTATAPGAIYSTLTQALVPRFNLPSSSDLLTAPLPLLSDACYPPPPTGAGEGRLVVPQSAVCFFRDVLWLVRGAQLLGARRMVVEGGGVPASPFGVEVLEEGIRLLSPHRPLPLLDVPAMPSRISLSGPLDAHFLCFCDGAPGRLVAYQLIQHPRLSSVLVGASCAVEHRGLQAYLLGRVLSEVFLSDPPRRGLASLHRYFVLLRGYYAVCGAYVELATGPLEGGEGAKPEEVVWWAQAGAFLEPLTRLLASFLDHWLADHPPAESRAGAGEPKELMGLAEVLKAAFALWSRLPAARRSSFGTEILRGVLETARQAAPLGSGLRTAAQALGRLLTSVHPSLLLAATSWDALLVPDKRGPSGSAAASLPIGFTVPPSWLHPARATWRVRVSLTPDRIACSSPDQSSSPLQQPSQQPTRPLPPLVPFPALLTDPLAWALQPRMAPWVPKKESGTPGAIATLSFDLWHGVTLGDALRTVQWDRWKELLGKEAVSPDLSALYGCITSPSFGALPVQSLQHTLLDQSAASLAEIRAKSRPYLIHPGDSHSAVDAPIQLLMQVPDTHPSARGWWLLGVELTPGWVDPAHPVACDLGVTIWAIAEGGVEWAEAARWLELFVGWLAPSSPSPSEQQPMPKNKGKGGKNRRKGKNENELEKRELIFKEEGQVYAQVLKMLGNGRLEAHCFDGHNRQCHIRGKLRKKVWVNTGDIILVGLRDYQDDKADVILKYTSDEARKLKEYHEIPDSAQIVESEVFGDEGEDVAVEFGDEPEQEEVNIDDL